MKKQQLKFRAWDTKNKIMRNWGEYYSSARWFSIMQGNQPNILLMQFTGLLDKNEKEIYEGDILKIVDRFQNWDDICEVVSTSCSYSCKRIKFDNIKKSYFTPEEQGYQIGKHLMGFRTQEDREIIGNIYENDKLLSS